MRRNVCCPVVAIAIGVLLIVLGIIIQFVVVPEVFNSHVEIKNGSTQYKNWYKPTVPVYMQWYVFNLTNGPQVQAKSEKPNFVQHGPYTYRENRWKENITWHDNGTVTYKNLRWWEFVPDMSTGTEEDIIYSINLPLVTVAEALRYENVVFKEAFDLLAYSFKEKLYKKYTMKDLIWGYHDPMMTEAMNLLPSWFYTDFVGVFAGKNYTDDGVWTVSTGENNISTVGQTEAYNGSRHLNFWSTDTTNMVNGTDGTIGPPHLDKHRQSSVQFFVPDICRSLYAVYAGEEKTTENITLYRYTSVAEELESPSKNPANSGFCTPRDNCRLGDGMLNLSTCQLLDHFNVPIVASLPHFLFADDKYLDMVDGLNPVESEHRTDVSIEPITGMVMRLAKRLQINMYLQPVHYLRILADVDEMVFPVAWLNESAVIDKDNQDLYYSMMHLMKAANIISYILYAVGVLLVLIAAVYLIYQYIQSRQEECQPLIGGSGSTTPAYGSANPSIHSDSD